MTLSEINKYQDFVKELNNGLQIMQKHSGKSSYQEIVNDYITSFEENIRLSNHVYDLGEEIIRVNEEIAANEEQINSLNSSKETDNSSKEKILNEKTAVLKDLKNKNLDIKNNTQELKNKLKELMDPLNSMKNAFKEVNLPLKFSHDELISNDSESQPDLDVDRMKILLKHLEEYIDQLVLMKNSSLNENSCFNFEIPQPGKLSRTKLDMDIEALVENDDYVLMTEGEMKNKAIEIISKLETPH